MNILFINSVLDMIFKVLSIIISITVIIINSKKLSKKKSQPYQECDKEDSTKSSEDN